MLNACWPNLPSGKASPWAAAVKASELFNTGVDHRLQTKTEASLHKNLQDGTRNVMPLLFFLDFLDTEGSSTVQIQFGRFGLGPVIKALSKALALRLESITAHVRHFRFKYSSKLWDPPAFRTLQITLDSPFIKDRVTPVCPSYT